MGADNEISLRERIRLNLIDAMKNAGVTQVQLADKLNISKGTVNNWTRGNNSPDVDMVPKICGVLGISIIDLYSPRDSEPHTTSTIKKAPSELSEEAHKIAKSYEKLTDHGKGAVKAILGYEGKELAHHIQQEDEDGKIITLPTSKRNGHGFIEIKVYNQPAAAGLGNYLDEPDFRVEQYPPKVIPSKTDFGVIISGDSMEPKIHDGGTVFVRAMPAIDPGQIGIFVLDGKAFCKKLMVDQINRQIHLVSLNPQYEDIIVDEDTDTFRTLGRVLGQWTPGYKQDLLEW